MRSLPINMKGFGSIPHAKRVPVVKDGIRRINGRQVDLLMSLQSEAGWGDDRMLELIRQCCPGVNINSFADCVDGPPMQQVVAVLRGPKEEEKA